MPSRPPTRSTPAAEDDPRASARAAGLRYVRDDDLPGIRRRRCGRGFTYIDPRGETVRDPAERARFEALAIPPAWTDVWICPFADGHVQATGRDDAGRKQYRYHPDWGAIRDQTKFARLAEFGAALPRLRRRVERDLALEGAPRERVVAAVVRLLERSLIRVGNDEYARDNGSYGLTTLRRRHADVDGDTVRFEFRGKSGKRLEAEVDDPRLAEVVRECQELRGQELFTYLDDDGRRCDVGSGDVNDYLREATGEEFTAKDFRTWAGTVLASLALSEFESFDTQAAAKRNLTRAIEHVAKRLGNTVAVCRKSYIHPAILDAYLDGSLLAFLKGEVEAVLREELAGLSGEEAAVLAFLQQRLSREVDRRKKRQTEPRNLKKTLRAAVAQEARSPRRA